MKMQRVIVIPQDYLHHICTYNCFEKRHKNMSVHLYPCFRDVQISDNIIVGECSPLSKTSVLQCTQGHQGCWHQEAVPEVMGLDACPPPKAK
ncbi:Hypothetical predicted protein [Marmota monax]|uniref:Uncharacterized protein n=1 Tax=Marmota monax TaxID=9995 RepID=A0A5E4BMU4_MARMO|nr:hypothetical protein GHT09_013414 [Marmota monax]VTJ70311.1 Hypothetical predicted protein [Marmota monax]